MLYSAKDCTVQRTNQTIKDGMGGSMGSRADTAKQYNKYEKKCNKELKAINNQNKMFYGISKNSGSHRELKNIQKISAKSPKKAATLVATIPVTIRTPIPP